MMAGRRRTSSCGRVAAASSLVVIVLVVVVVATTFIGVTVSSVRAATPPQPQAILPSLVLRARLPSSSSSISNGGRKRLPTTSSWSSSSSSSHPTPSALWLYQGALYDPLDGRKIATVQGVEVVRAVVNTTGLAVHAILNRENATYGDCRTFWSQKVFCYTTARGGEGNGAGGEGTRRPVAAADGTAGGGAGHLSETLLQSVQVRPQSPRKRIPLDQAVAVYETATTFISRKAGATTSTTSSPDDGGGDEEVVVVHSEFPNGQTVWSTAQGCRWNSDTAGIDFTVYAKLRSQKSPLYAPDLAVTNEGSGGGGPATAPSRLQRSGGGGSGSSFVVSPKRSAIVQFGSSSGTMESKHKFGARETYSYRNVPPRPNIDDDDDEGGTGGPRRLRNRIYRKWGESIFRFAFPFSNNKGRSDRRQQQLSVGPTTTLHYTRYGEGPPFYAPGRMCMLELQARPIASLTQATPVLKRLLLDQVGTGGGRPLVVGFAWKDSDDGIANQEGVVAGGGRSVGTETDTPTIQKSWNLIGKGSNQGGRRRRLAATSTSLLRLQQPSPNDDVDGHSIGLTSLGGGRHLPLWMRKGGAQAASLWERLRQASTVEPSI